MSFVKLDCGILRSSLWAEDAETRIVFLTLLALSDADGFVEAAAPGLALSANVPLDRVRAALARLEAPDPDSRTPSDEGRRVLHVEGGYHIVNYSKYRAIRDPDVRRQQTREAVARHRATMAGKSKNYCKPKKANVSQCKPMKANVSQRKPPKAQEDVDVEEEVEEVEEVEADLSADLKPPSQSSSAADLGGMAGEESERQKRVGEEKPCPPDTMTAPAALQRAAPPTPTVRDGPGAHPPRPCASTGLLCESDEADLAASEAFAARPVVPDDLPLPSLNDLALAWNGLGRFTPVSGLTREREVAFRRCCADAFFREHFLAALHKAARLDWCNGLGSRGWQMTLAWFLKPDNVRKIVEATISESGTARRAWPKGKHPEECPRCKGAQATEWWSCPRHTTAKSLFCLPHEQTPFCGCEGAAWVARPCEFVPEARSATR